MKKGKLRLSAAWILSSLCVFSSCAYAGSVSQRSAKASDSAFSSEYFDSLALLMNNSFALNAENETVGGSEKTLGGTNNAEESVVQSQAETISETSAIAGTGKAETAKSKETETEKPAEFEICAVCNSHCWCAAPGEKRTCQPNNKESCCKFAGQEKCELYDENYCNYFKEYKNEKDNKIESKENKEQEINLEISTQSLTAGQFILAKVTGYDEDKPIMLRYSKASEKIFTMIKADGFYYGFAPVSSMTDGLGYLQVVKAGDKKGEYKTLAQTKVTQDKRSFERQDLTVESGSSMEKAGSSSNLEHDNKLIEKAMKSPLLTIQFDGAFVMPAEGRISTQYGMRRYTNGKFTSAHSGYDIAAPEGTEIAAAGGGKVVFAGEMKFYGNTVIIDHGLGVFSFYNHMSRLVVAEEQDIKSGELIGYIGTTGYSTGPHLHFNIKVNNINVDPAVFIGTDLIYSQLERMINQ